MTGRNVQGTLAALREAWERRALENPKYYVATGRRDWTDEEFYRSGELTVEHFILMDPENTCQGRDPRCMRVLEIGCGAGRVTRALARHFGEVHAVDISPEMVRLARAAVASFPNAHVYQNNGIDLSVLPPLEFDFAFSTIVFQHIPSRAIIENYFREVHRVLRPGGLFKLDVQGMTTPAPSPLRRAASGCLRTLVPARRRRHEEERTWFGWIVSAENAGELAAATGFDLRYQVGSDQQNFWLWLYKPLESSRIEGR